jgi:hypothetical protein
MVGVLTFTRLFADMAMKGFERLDYDFMTNFPSRRAGSAGILSAWVGTIPGHAGDGNVCRAAGCAAGIYLEEYAPKNWVTDIIEINVTNLAGVPSIVYGLLALGLVCAYKFGFGQSVLSAGLTLALLILARGHRRDARIDPRDSSDGARGLVCLRRDDLADGQGPYPAVFECRHPDRHHHRHGARHR